MWIFWTLLTLHCPTLILVILCTLCSYRSKRTSLFDGIEEGGIRATSYSSHEIDEQENDRAIDGLQDRVSILRLHFSLVLSSLIKLDRMLQCNKFWCTYMFPSNCRYAMFYEESQHATTVPWSWTLLDRSLAPFLDKHPCFLLLS